MTKAELIQALEPFSDEIEIRVSDHGEHNDIVKVKYHPAAPDGTAYAVIISDQA